MNIEPARTIEHISLAKTLFLEYEGAIGVDLEYQGFTAELAGLPTFGQAMLSMAADTIATVITFPMMISVFVLVYHDLKLRKEGHDLDARVEALTVGA